ncbi:5-deoxy-glucuronate isomerase [Streptomyces sp. NPDC049906]|uniref:5-deoxy-glucuronate isomerase n=1 Tax=Streptomyces sp. NPDC049906 TaxID=3155656 RepID=UPI00342120D1
MKNSRHHLPDGIARRDAYDLMIEPRHAGWSYAGLRVLSLEPDTAHTLVTGDSEWIVLPLEGSCTVRVDRRVMELVGRRDVFEGVSDFAYVPRDAYVGISSGTGGLFALAGAKCERRLPARYGPAPEVPVEARGSGLTAREVRNFAAVDAFDCERLIAVEVVTPGGNWSSYPPHKHDERLPGRESELEEIYYYRCQPSRDGLPGFGYQRVSRSRDDGTDLLAEVRSGDTVLVPDGWHGPSVAAPDHPMYYLNVMAGPRREWLISFHPDHPQGYR